MEFLEINNIFYKTENFTLDIKKMKILKNKINIILGENGSGKSTLLNYIINNDVLKGYKKILLTQRNFVFNRSCEKNIEMVLKWNKSSEIKNSNYYLKLVGLENKKNILAKKLSGGEKKRLSFAMALATNADIILLDEPFANIDYKNQKKLIEILNKLKNKKNIIIVSHRVKICEDIGDYFMHIEEGKILKENIKENIKNI